MLQIYLQSAKPLFETDLLLLIRTPLVLHQLPDLGQTVLLGPLVLRCLGRPYGPLSFFSSSGASQETEYLSFGHSNGVCLRQRQKITSYGGALIVEVG
jgi:hypothetical protein